MLLISGTHFDLTYERQRDTASFAPGPVANRRYCRENSARVSLTRPFAEHSTLVELKAVLDCAGIHSYSCAAQAQLTA